MVLGLFAEEEIVIKIRKGLQAVPHRHEDAHIILHGDKQTLSAVAISFRFAVWRTYIVDVKRSGVTLAFI